MWMFVMPVLHGRDRRDDGRGRRPHEADLVVPDQVDLALPHVDAAPGDLGYEVRTAETPEAPATFRRQLTVASGFASGVMAGTKQTLQFKRAGEMDLDARLDQVRLNRAMFRTSGDAIATARPRRHHRASAKPEPASPR